MERKKIPQLRILLTDFCDSHCVYCRPTGEGNKSSKNRIMSFETAKTVANIYKNQYGAEVKLTGGDPAFWPYLVQFIDYLKSDLMMSKVELISRSIQLKKYIDLLAGSGLDVLNFSLDSISPEKYHVITGKNDYYEYISLIKECAKKFYCKINSVITSNNEWRGLVDFCIETGVKQLKLLDFIDDISSATDIVDDTFDFKTITHELRAISIKEEVIYQGGLGHPMTKFTLSSGLEVIIKDSQKGAWYSKPCKKCPHYPCHDALMALRVTPSNTFQLCLLNDKMHWHFDPSNVEDVERKLHSIMSIYDNAFFTQNEEELKMKKILLTSTGFTNKNLERVFIENSSKKTADMKVLFVPTAANDEESRSVVPFCRQDLTDAGVPDDSIVTYDCDRDITADELLKYDAIYFCGGSSAHLMKRVNESGFAKPLLEAVEKGLFYIGVSAGSMIASMAVENNLGIVPNPIKPHCTSDITPNGAVPAPGEPINLSDDSALWICGDKMEILS